MPELLPEDFVAQMKNLLSNDYQAFEQSIQEKEAVSIRFNPYKKSSISTDEIVPWEVNAGILEHRPSFAQDPLWHAGAYYVQESSSMFLGEVIRLLKLDQSPQTVLDLCAAPGGKSTHLLSTLHPESLLVSNEILPKRNKILCENLQRWGFPNVIVTQNPPDDFKRIPEFFDIMVTDAPCSGEGLFRKQKEAIQEWSLENVYMCAQRQKDILASASAALKTDGILIYSTCTFNTHENETVIASMIETGFWELIPILPSEKYASLLSEGSIEGTWHFYPHKVTGSGFFIAALRKIKPSFEKIQQLYKGRPYYSLYSAKENDWEKFIAHPEQFAAIINQDNIHLIPKRYKNLFGIIDSSLKVTQAGIEIGNYKKGVFLPSHALALSIIHGNNIPTIALDKQQALKYLKKESPEIKTDIKGWALVSFEDIPLGWVKVIPGRINNYLPLPFMLRMDIKSEE